ncbi:hypothetical protein MHK_002780, partial [Candidatus Magnetomorum sp. HK-1]
MQDDIIEEQTEDEFKGKLPGLAGLAGKPDFPRSNLNHNYSPITHLSRSVISTQAGSLKKLLPSLS